MNPGVGWSGFRRRGQVNHVAWRYAIAGGNWNEGVRNGSRTLNTNANAWNANGNVTTRGVSDAAMVQIFKVTPERSPRRLASQWISRPIPAARSNIKKERRVAIQSRTPLPLMAKKHDKLIEQIADWDNLLLAHQRARAGKRDRLEVQTFSGDLWLHLGNIQHHLLAGTYRMGVYRGFVVFEPKRREILAAPFGDRVVQHALLNVLAPIWDACMIDDTFACRPGKGVHVGVVRLQRWLRDMAAHQPLADIWIAKTDFSGYFKNIRHADLKRICRRKIACPRTLQALDTIIDSTPGGVGIPVGNLTSQWLANLLGNELDQWIKRELGVKRYLRYMDDCVAIFASQADAQRFIRQLEVRAAQHGLWFSKSSVHRASQGVNMLGYRIWPTHKLLRRRAIVAFRRDVRHLRKRIETGNALLTDVTLRVKAFAGHAKHADTWRLRGLLFNEGASVSGRPKKTGRLPAVRKHLKQPPPP